MDELDRALQEIARIVGLILIVPIALLLGSFFALRWLQSDTLPCDADYRHSAVCLTTFEHFQTFGLDFSSDGTVLVSRALDDDNPIQMWRRDEQNIWQDIPVRLSTYLVDIDVSPDGKMLAALQRDELLEMFSTETGALVRHFRVPEYIDGHLAYSPVEDIIAEGNGTPADRRGRNGAINLRRGEDGTRIRELTWLPIESYSTLITDLTFSNNGQMLAVSMPGDDRVRLWRVSDGTLIHTIPVSGPNVIAFSPDDSLLAVGIGSQIAVLRVDTTQRIHTLGNRGWFIFYAGITDLAFSPDGRFLVAGNTDGMARIWHVDTGRLVASLPTGYIFDPRPVHVAFSPDGNILAVGQRNGEIRLVDFPALLAVHGVE